MSSRLDCALALARQGLLIFPLRPGVKTPYGGDEWKLMMTSDETTIRGWFETREGMNYAVCGGDKFFVLDLDFDPGQEKDGIATLAELEETQDPGDWVTDATFTVKSPRGGRHLYLSGPKPVGCSIGTFAQGIDIRGGLEGSEGYVVGPGCTTAADPSRNTAAGEYVIISDQPIARASDWIMTRVETSNLARAENADDSVLELDLPEQIERARTLIRQQTAWPTEGEGGDDATYHFCALIRDEAVSPETCFELLNEALYEDGATWNERCDPPWTDAGLWTKINNAFRYGKNQPGSKGGLLDTLPELGADAAEIAAKAERLLAFKKFTAMTFRGEELTARSIYREMIIPGWLPANGMTQVLGKRGAGKSVIIADMALRIARGDMLWHNLPIAPGWTVLYLCGEDDLGLQEHISAWKILHGAVPDNFIVITDVPNLMSADDVRLWSTYVNELVGDSKVLTILDTWQRASSHASQNDDAEMQTAIENAEAFAASLRGPCCALFHPPKHNDKTISGSQIVENSGVSIWAIAVEGDGFTRRMEVIRMKGKGERNYMTFAWNEIKLGSVDQFGLPRTGVVPKQTSGTDMPISKEAVENQNTARYWYGSAIGECIKQYNAKREGEKKSGDLSLKHMAGHVYAFLNKHENATWRQRLQSCQNFTYGKDVKAMERLFHTMFSDNESSQETEGGLHIKLFKLRKNSTMFDYVDKKESAGPSEMDRLKDDLDI